MKRTAIALFAASSLMLAACQTPGAGPGPGPTPPHPIVTPERCASVLQGAAVAGRMLETLESFGLPVTVATAAATLLAIGKTSVTVICSIFAHNKPLPAHPDELPLPTPDPVAPPSQ